MTREVSLRTLERGLQILRSLNQRDGSTVLGLSRSTGLSRPVISRVLETLVALGYAINAMSDGKYRITSAARQLSAGFDRRAELVEIARPHVLACGSAVGWPIGLSSYGRGDMVLLEHTFTGNPLSITPRLPLGYRIPVLSSSCGKAFVAFSSEQDRAQVLSDVSAQGAEGPLAKDAERLRVRVAKTVRQTVEAGYGWRLEGTRLGPKTSSISVPVRQQDKVVACLDLVYIGSVMRPHEAASRYLATLQDSARHIEDRLAAQAQA